MLFEYTDLDDFLTHRPIDCQLIGVELCEQATPLEEFSHPDRAQYILGPENGSLGAKVLSHCQSIVSFDSKFCVNVAIAGSITMYDRSLKNRLRDRTKGI